MENAKIINRRVRESETRSGVSSKRKKRAKKSSAISCLRTLSISVKKTKKAMKKNAPKKAILSPNTLEKSRNKATGTKANRAG